jgi:multiple antibiotic resistance protein
MIVLLAKAFLTLFVIIDPVGITPIYVALVKNRAADEQAKIADRAVLVAAIILLLAGLGGAYLLHYLGISIEALQIAAGVLLFKLAFDMIFVESDPEVNEDQGGQDVSIFPLAIPLIAGPGALTSILVLSQETSNYYLGLLVVLSATALVLLITYILLRFSSYLSASLHPTGINVVIRVFGVLVAALSVQYMADGLLSLLQLPPTHAFALEATRSFP